MRRFLFSLLLMIGLATPLVVGLVNADLPPGHPAPEMAALPHPVDGTIPTPRGCFPPECSPCPCGPLCECMLGIRVDYIDSNGVSQHYHAGAPEMKCPSRNHPTQ